ncbi:hypothetical protein IQ07DRAFT_443 [Pyrenochaeta sp. DS3sAY3a]|nr:hypothetical protein IQ07DRAFT_443 [Pyrenochaeta sp. DS3sAY3a]
MYLLHVKAPAHTILGWDTTQPNSPPGRVRGGSSVYHIHRAPTLPAKQRTKKNGTLWGVEVHDSLMRTRGSPGALAELWSMQITLASWPPMRWTRALTELIRGDLYSCWPWCLLSSTQEVDGENLGETCFAQSGTPSAVGRTTAWGTEARQVLTLKPSMILIPTIVRMTASLSSLSRACRAVSMSACH